MTAAAASPGTSSEKRRLVGIFAAGMTTFITLYSTQSLLPLLASAFGTGVTQMGLTVTASLVAVALVAPFVGAISDAAGRRRLILGAAMLMVVPTLGCAFAPSFAVLLACRFAQGLLAPFIFTVTVAYVADECPGATGIRATAVYATGTIVGGFAGRFVGGWVATFYDWHGAFLALAALTAAGALTIHLCLPTERRFQPISGWHSRVEGFVDQFRNLQVMATCAVGFAVLFSLVAAFTFANVLLAAPPFLLGPAALGSIFVVYLVGAAAPPVTARLVPRLGRRRTAVLGGLVVAAGLLLTLVPALPAIVAGLALLAAGVFTEQALSIGHVALAARQARSTAVGLYVTAYYAGGALGGIAPAWAWHHAGWPGCVALVLAVQASALLVAWLVWPPRSGLPSARAPQMGS